MSAARQPLVSVVICTYNAGAHLRSSLLSVLGQTYKNIEVLLVDDGSTDGSVEAVRDIVDPRIRRFRQDNQGKSVALNWALREMHGEYYALHDADDLSYERRIERQMEAASCEPGLAAVFCGHDVILRDRRVAPIARSKDPAECRRDIGRMAMPAHDPTGMYRVQMVRGIEYDASLRVGQGFDYILRVGEMCPMRVIGECLYSYRISSHSNTKRDPARRLSAVEAVVEKACRRRGLDFQQVLAERREAWARWGKHRLSDNNLAAHFIDSVHSQRHAGKRLGALMTGAACSLLHPLDPHYHKALLYAIAPMKLVQCLRGAFC